MTQEEAREILNRLVDGESFPSFRFPVYELVIRGGKPNLDMDFNNVNSPSFIIEDYSFRELIKTAYNLKEND